MARLACLLLIVTTLSALPAIGTASASDPGPRERARKVTWHNTTYSDADGLKVAATGKVRGGKRKLKLQVKVPGGWRTFARGHSKKSGKFHVDGRLKWYGTHKVRIHAGGRRSFNKSTKIHVNPSWAPRGASSSHGFMKNRGYRYKFDPCQVIRYQVNASDVGPVGIDLAKMAMEQAAWASGMKVRYAGTTNFVPFAKRRAKPRRGIDLVIAWAGSDQIKRFQGNTGGIGGPLTGRSGIARKGHNKVWRITSSGVTMNTDQWVNGTQYAGWDGPIFTVGMVLLHEIGHAFGLRHVNHPEQLMYPTTGPPDADGVYRARYSAGDLAGMRRSGLAGGCVRKALWRTRTARVSPAPVPAPVPDPLPYTFHR
ncbi:MULTISPECIES: matrixin family metalloprotease [unclassified Nocardioides]|uniref:matrixin family metalloprotease n=1 Tax=unclassified Nocardioides TaxID=2615069 RepID=UPI00361FDECE